MVHGLVAAEPTRFGPNAPNCRDGPPLASSHPVVDASAVCSPDGL